MTYERNSRILEKRNNTDCVKVKCNKKAIFKCFVKCFNKRKNIL